VQERKYEIGGRLGGVSVALELMAAESDMVLRQTTSLAPNYLPSSLFNDNEETQQLLSKLC
jgi:hypothetical protein